MVNRIPALAMVCLASACSHPLQIIGYGDIASTTGTRDCSYEDHEAAAATCTENLVVGAYQETYTATPHDHWRFHGWHNYCTRAPYNQCSFDVQASWVEAAWGDTAPPLVAEFREGLWLQGKETLFADGKLWLQPNMMTGLSWNDVIAQCPEGVCPPGAWLNAWNIAGWQVATVNELNSLINTAYGSALLGPGPDGLFGNHDEPWGGAL